jgi:hypothetical protein
MSESTDKGLGLVAKVAKYLFVKKGISFPEET